MPDESIRVFLLDDHEIVRRGLRDLFEREGFEEHDDRFTTFVDVGDFLHKRREALLAHRTQVDPTGFWMRLPDEVVREVFPWEEFVLARTLVDTGVPDGEAEDDLFAGLRAPVRTR